MREIEFRAWDKIEKVMIYPEQEIKLGENISPISMLQYVPAWFHQETDDRIFLQYVGLKDKNGVKIFEGDIIGTKGIGGKNGFIGITEVKDLRSFYSMVDDYEFALNPEEYEVIGNIYENPELIDGKEK